MIFIDRSIPKGIADAFSCVRDDVCWLEPTFPHDTKDLDWMPEVAKLGWPAISRDKKIRTRPLERRQVYLSKLGCFVLAQNTNPTRWEYLKLLVKTMDEIEAKFASTPKPFIYLIDASGKIRLDGKFDRMAKNGWLSESTPVKADGHPIAPQRPASSR